MDDLNQMSQYAFDGVVEDKTQQLNKTIYFSFYELYKS